MNQNSNNQEGLRNKRGLLVILATTTLLMMGAVSTSIASPQPEAPEVIVPQQITLPKGEYYIGDLCYVIRKEWTSVVDQYFDNQKKSPNLNLHLLTIERNDKKPLELVMFFTGSDGTYYFNGPEKEENAITVDSGSIGIVDTSLLDPETLEERAFLGHIHRFEKDFVIKYDKKIIEIGDLYITQEE